MWKPSPSLFWPKVLSFELSFIKIHYFYIISFILAGALCMTFAGMPFMDALFFASGSCTGSGLNSIDINKINTFQQFVTYFLPLVTSPIFIHTAVVVFRLIWFEKRLKNIVIEARQNVLNKVSTRSKTIRDLQDGVNDPERRHSGKPAAGTVPTKLEKSSIQILGAARTERTKIENVESTTGDGPSRERGVYKRCEEEPETNSGDRIKFDPAIESHQGRSTMQNDESLSIYEVPTRSRSVSRRLSLDRIRHLSRTKTMMSTQSQSTPAPYLSYVPEVGRNSMFLDLTPEQRNELGGIEYRALKTLLVILILYYVLINLFGVVVLYAWILKSPKYGRIVSDYGVNRGWWAAYTTISLFGEVGYTLTPDSMISFQQAAFLLIFCCFLVVAGNTGFPLLLRLIIWTAFKLCPERWVTTKDELHFLLDHPRRCFTLLFPSGPTWWLFGILVFLNVADVILFLVLDQKTPVVESLPMGFRFVNALFQAVNTRTAGSASMPIGALHPAVQVSYLIMMYISIMPIAISIRRTNVYEDLSLGVWADPAQKTPDKAMTQTEYLKAHVRRQLEFDLWYVFAGLFLISCAEGSRIVDSNNSTFTLFSIFFEVVSAYGGVGLSLGYPGVNISLSGVFSNFSKLVVVAMEIRGRHRGLPYDLDRAVVLPEVAYDEVRLGRVPTIAKPGRALD